MSKNKKSPEFKEKVKALLFKKKIYEHKVKVAQNGANIKLAYVKAMEDRLSQLEEGSYEHCKLQNDLLEMRRDARDWVSDFKQYNNYYGFGLDSELKDTLSKKEYSKLEWESWKEEAEKMAERDLYGEVVFVAENIELPKIISRIQEKIDALEGFVSMTRSAIENYGDKDLEYYRLVNELFDAETHLITLTKRLRKRQDYYVNQFMPVYEKDMKECAEYLDTYLQYTSMVIEYNIDPQIKYMIDHYEEIKGIEEEKWLFFTALRERLKSIAKELGKDMETVKKFPRLDGFIKFFN